MCVRRGPPRESIDFDSDAKLLGFSAIHVEQFSILSNSLKYQCIDPEMTYVGPGQRREIQQLIFLANSYVLLDFRLRANKSLSGRGLPVLKISPPERANLARFLD